MLMPVTSPDFERNVKMLAYVRERSRVLLLSELLILKETLSKERQSQVMYEQIKKQCWELLKSSDLPPSGFMLHDSEDVLNFACIAGDSLRLNALERLSRRYCREVLLILFECYLELQDL